MLRKTLRRNLILLLLATLYASGQTADPQDLVSQKFKDKIFNIKGWYQDKKLTYDASGTVVGHPQPGSWTTSGVQIRSVKVSEDVILLKGKRIGYVYDQANHSFSPVHLKETDNVTITIGRAATTITSADLDVLEKAIFVHDIRSEDVPEYWREFLKQGEESGRTKANTRTLPDEVQGVSSGAAPVYRVGPEDHVIPPHLVKQQDPSVPEIARGAEIHGITLMRIVVETNGVPTQLQILRPVGMGFDDAAAHAITAWRFKPAMRDGKPVPVQVDIDIHFNAQ